MKQIFRVAVRLKTILIHPANLFEMKFGESGSPSLTSQWMQIPDW